MFAHHNPGLDKSGFSKDVNSISRMMMARLLRHTKGPKA